MEDRLKCCFIIGLILFFFNGYGQGEQVFITGLLLDAKTNEPVVFASIRIKDRALGVISNLDGDFRIPSDYAEKGSELEISSMGYETKTLTFTSLSSLELNVIYLQPALLQLNEAVVTGKRKRLSARKVIKKAVANIPNNYPLAPFHLVGYYRDYQLRKGDYINLNEAIVGVYDRGFAEIDYHTTAYGLYSYEKNTSFQIDSFAAKPYNYGTRDKFIPSAKLESAYGGNELVILNIHDAIRNHSVRAYSYVHRLVEDFVKDHRFPKMETTSYGGQSVFKIAIKKNEFPFSVDGAIYIDKDDYAIRKLDYSAYRFGGTNPGTKQQNKKTLLYEILVEYKEEGDTMFLNYISFHNIFTIKRPAEFTIEEAALDKQNGVLNIKFNKPMAKFETIDGGVSIYVQGKPLRVANIVQAKEDELKVILSNKKNAVAIREKLFAKFGEEDMLEVFIDIKNLKDAQGNLLNERKEETLDQFREFFTQRIIPNPKPIDKKGLMLKNIPIYDIRQPRYSQEEQQGFWLNTPLKKTQ